VKKAENESASVEDLRQRLQTAEDALSEKEAKQIERENAIIARFDTQNRRFISKPSFTCLFVFVFILFLEVDGLVFCSSRADG
jgi:uncharacterized membrane protein